MNPILDQLLVAAIILAALAFFVLRALRRKKGCNCGCDCAAPKLKKP